MVKKILCVIMLMLTLVCVLTACGHIHSYSNGNCTICDHSIITTIGDIIKENPDQYAAGAYLKVFSCSTFSSKEDAQNCVLGFAYDESDKSLLIKLSKNDVANDSFSFMINGGIISNNYEYTYSHTNSYGPYTDEIKGVFNATSLSSTTIFNYTDYSAGSGKAFIYFIDDYKEDAASYAKLLTEYLNDFCIYNEFGFTAEAFNLK